MPDEARDGRNVALIGKCFMVCSIVQRRAKLLYQLSMPINFHESINLCSYTVGCLFNLAIVLIT